MNPKPKLLVAPCSFQAAKYAVEHWHYSGCMPAGKTVKFGVWEDDGFIGAVIFGRGANNHLFNPYELDQQQGCELTRVALTSHKCYVSKIIAVSIRLLKGHSDGLRLIISFADEQQQGHLGIVYQSSNWIYLGSSQSQREVMINGKIMHKRTAHAKFGTIKGLTKSEILWKHKYLYPLDRAMRRQIEPLRQSYPKRETLRATDGS